MGGDREGLRGYARLMAAGSPPVEPLRILMSAEAARAHAQAVADSLPGRSHRIVDAGDADLAFVSRDVTGLSTKHRVLPATQAFYDLLTAAPSLRWVHIHSAGADRPVFGLLRQRGVAVTTSTGANAAVVAQTAVAGLLCLARRFPQLMAAQRERRWAPLIAQTLPRDLAGQRATIVGWGPIGREAARLLQAFGLRVAVVRSGDAPAGPGIPTVAFERLGELLPATDWLLLACPLTERTRGLVGTAALARLQEGAHLLNLARGEIVDEAALIDALRAGRLAGAFLDVFAQEPLPPESPLWDLPNVVATPHSAGFSDGNAARVVAMFLDNLRRWCAGEDLVGRAL